MSLLTLTMNVLSSCDKTNDVNNNGDVNEDDNNIETPVESKKAKFVFYFIGDGMAAVQVNLAEAAMNFQSFKDAYEHQTRSNVGIGTLRLREMTIAGMANTHAENRYITCSAAAATALATGSKGEIDRISEKPDGTDLQTIAEIAKSKGMKVGIISSVSIDHATPACFYAHTNNRNNYKEIGDQLLASGFDYFAGGSVRWNKRIKEEGGTPADAYARYAQAAKEKGFKYVTSKAQFDALKAGETAPVIATLDMLANEQYTGDGSALPYAMDLYMQEKIDNKISLADFTAKGAEILENDNGFMMVIESGKIDWACHANDAVASAYDMVAFDEADVYFGAFGGYDPYTTTCVQILNAKAGVDFTSYKHTAVPVPVFAYGVNDQLFNGYYDNTDIPKKIIKATVLDK